MKAIILIAAIAATMTLMSCSKNVDEALNNYESTLNISADFNEIKTRSTISAFSPQSAIGLFVTKGALGTNYNNVASNANVKSVYNGSSWQQTPPVYLSPANATVFAYYPYNSSNNDGTRISIEHNNQIDYLYGSHPTVQIINNGNPNVNLTMYHALSLIQFQVRKANYTGPGILTKIEIANKAGKTSLYSEGTMNIATGAINYTTNKNQPAILNLSYSLPGSFSANAPSLLRLMVLPVTTNVAEGDLQIKFTIDGKIYTYNVPAGIKWEKGKINTYTVTLSGKELIVNNVSISNWTNGITGNVTIG